MEKAIYFDMDGTLAGLFCVKGFREMLNKKDATPYKIAPAMFDRDGMKIQIERLKKLGYTIGIISYCDGGDFAKEVRKAKKEWLAVNFPYASEIHIIQKGRTKSAVAAIKNGILVDDAKKNRAEWKHGATVNAYRADLVAELAKIIE